MGHLDLLDQEYEVVGKLDSRQMPITVVEPIAGKSSWEGQGPCYLLGIRDWLQFLPRMQANGARADTWL